MNEWVWIGVQHGMIRTTEKGVCRRLWRWVDGWWCVVWPVPCCTCYLSRTDILGYLIQLRVEWNKYPRTFEMNCFICSTTSMVCEWEMVEMDIAMACERMEAILLHTETVGEREAREWINTILGYAINQFHMHRDRLPTSYTQQSKLIFTTTATTTKERPPIKSPSLDLHSISHLPNSTTEWAT